MTPPAPAEADFDPVAYINESRWRESRLGLHRIRALLDRMGNPQRRLRFVHVAGTNGKGSVCAYAASILQAAGYKTGLFTSPYIMCFEERIRVDGKNIAAGDLRETTLFVREHASAVEAATGEHPTEFELMCAVAFEHFARSGCDLVVAEVGLGGRLDATNVVEAPEACVVTRIGLDHTGILGDTLEKIAAEKAGILKPGVPAVSYPQEGEAMAVVAARARELGCPLVVPDVLQLQVGGVVSRSFAEGSERPRDAWYGGMPHAGAATSRTNLATEGLMRTFAYRGIPYETRLLGTYQPENAVLAIEAAEVLRRGGWRIAPEDVCAGIARTVWPGRFEVRPLPDGPQPQTRGQTLVVDGGHNPQGARALADSLRDVFPGRCPVLIMGVLADKDYPAMVAEVAPLARAFVCIAPDSPRALPADELADEISRQRAARSASRGASRDDGEETGSEEGLAVECAASAEDALTRARRLAGEGGLVCVFGSLYSVAPMEQAVR